MVPSDAVEVLLSPSSSSSSLKNLTQKQKIEVLKDDKEAMKNLVYQLIVDNKVERKDFSVIDSKKSELLKSSKSVFYVVVISAGDTELHRAWIPSPVFTIITRYQNEISH